MQLQCNYNATTMLAWQSLCLCSSVTAVYTAYLWLPIALTHPLSLPFPQPQFPTRPYYFLLPPSQYHMAFDEGWAISARLQEAISLRPQPLEKAGKSHLPIGYYRINLSIIEPDNLYEFETVHFINITGQLNIGHNYLVAQLRHGEIVHVYGTGEDRASFFNEEGTAVAPLVTLACGRRRVHVRLPYFGAMNEKCGWMTSGSWMVPLKMCSARPFQLLTANFTMNRRGCTFFSWDPSYGPFSIDQRLNAGSCLSPARHTVIGCSAFQFTSEFGYLDIAHLVIPRCPRQRQPEGRGEDHIVAMDLEEELLRHGGAWCRYRRREQELRRGVERLNRRPFNLRAVLTLNLKLAQRVTTLAVQQQFESEEEEEDDDPILD
jgi:hypothetical protein